MDGDLCNGLAPSGTLESRRECLLRLAMSDRGSVLLFERGSSGLLEDNDLKDGLFCSLFRPRPSITILSAGESLNNHAGTREFWRFVPPALGWSCTVASGARFCGLYMSAVRLFPLLFLLAILCSLNTLAGILFLNVARLQSRPAMATHSNAGLPRRTFGASESGHPYMKGDSLSFGLGAYTPEWRSKSTRLHAGDRC